MAAERPLQDVQVARGIQSIVLGFGLLQIIAEAGVPLSLKAIGSLSGMSPSKARMYLISLIETGMVTQNPESLLYSVGPYALRLGSRALRRMELITVATDAMNELQRQTRALVLLGAWSDQGITVVSRSEGGMAQPLQFHIGGSASLAGTAAGHIFLAFGPQEQIWPRLSDELAGLGLSKSEHNRRLKALETVIEAVRKRRIAQTGPISFGAGVTVSGLASIAAPVFDGAQRLRYAMTLIYPTVGGGRRRDQLGRLTLKAADHVSHVAGADPIAAAR